MIADAIWHHAYRFVVRSAGILDNDMKDDDFWALSTIGIALTLWLAAGLICVGRKRTYRLGLWLLGSGAAVGAIAGFYLGTNF